MDMIHSQWHGGLHRVSKRASIISQTLSVISVACVVLVAHDTSLAQSGGRPDADKQGAEAKADPRIVRTLSDAKLKFTVGKFGDCVLLYDLPEGRTHAVYVSSQTEQWGEMEIRDVWAFGYGAKARLSQSKLEKMLKANGQKKSGAWQLTDGEKLLAIFSVKVSADCSAEALRTVAVGVAEEADKMEQTLTSGKDEF